MRPAGARAFLRMLSICSALWEYPRKGSTKDSEGVRSAGHLSKRSSDALGGGFCSVAQRQGDKLSLRVLGAVHCGRHTGDDPLVPFLFSSQESSDHSGNGRQEQKFSMGRSHRGSFLPCGRASIGKSTDCNRVVREPHPFIVCACGS